MCTTTPLSTPTSGTTTSPATSDHHQHDDDDDDKDEEAAVSPVRQPVSVWIGRVMVLLAAAMYGSNFAVVKGLDASTSLSAGVTAALRFTWAAVVVTILTLANEERQKQQRRRLLAKRRIIGTMSTTSTIIDQHDDEEQHNAEEINEPPARRLQERQQQRQQQSSLLLYWPSTLRGLEVGGWYCIGYLSQAIALQTIDAGKCAFYSALSVVIVPLLDAAGKRQCLLSRRAVLAVVCAVAGVGVLELGGGGGSNNNGGPILQKIEMGDYLSFLMALTFAIGYWRLADVAIQYPTMTNRVTMGQLLAVAMGAILYAVVDHFLKSGSNNNETLLLLDQLVHELSRPTIVLQLAWSGLGPTALAVYLETIALQAITASELTLLMTSTSVWAAGFAYLVLAEVPTPLSLVGGGLILLGCVVYALGGGTQNKVAAANDDDDQERDARDDKSALEVEEGSHDRTTSLSHEDGGDEAVTANVDEGYGRSIMI
jgi:drug/metabolite transporter (DMT)-like permease